MDRSGNRKIEGRLRIIKAKYIDTNMVAISRKIYSHLFFKKL